jgi:hypothetical protein
MGAVKNSQMARCARNVQRGGLARDHIRNVFWKAEQQTKMKTHQQQISVILSTLAPRSQLVFGLLTADRLRCCCFVACDGSSEWKTFASILDQCFLMACRDRLDLSAIEDAITTLHEACPESGTHSQAQGQNSFLCLIQALRLVSGEGLDSIEGIINSIVDALDNYAFFVRRAITGEKTSPESYPLMEREMECQLDDLSFVSKNSDFTQMELNERRILNLQFVIPPAVGWSVS